MYKNNTNLEMPRDGQILLRYFEVKYFDSMIKKRALFFCRVDQLTDRFEGTYTRPANERRESSEGFRIFGKEYFSNATKTFRKQHYVNCWTMKPKESYFMWKVYSDYDKGVLISTTLEKFKKCFHKLDAIQNPGASEWNMSFINDVVWIGKVKYVDHFSDDMKGSFELPFFYKRNWFRDEEELRAIVPKLDDHQLMKKRCKGIFVSVDLSVLIEDVFVSPNCSPKFKKQIQHVINSAGDLDVTVKDSEFKSEVLY